MFVVSKVASMLPAIKLDDKSFRQTDEINNIRPKRLLPAKLAAE